MPTPDPQDALPVLDRRRAGVLLHPTSLSGPHGCGDLGPAAVAFLDWLRDAGQSAWQMLPLGPPAWGGSPYLCLSAFAGNPLLVSPERLVDDGLLDPADLGDAPDFEDDRVDYGRAGTWRETLLRRAWRRARGGTWAETLSRRDRLGDRADDRLDDRLEDRLEDWALFATLKDLHDGEPWIEWPEEHRRREPAAMAEVRRVHADAVAYHRFVQSVFDRQWRELRTAASDRGIRLVGDLPIYVAHDSADVWSRPELFDLDGDLRPRHVAGVPPDAFSDTGQLWGNPLYRWDRMESEGYAWWTERIRRQLRRFDLLRVDHFRGFQACWQVPAGDETAENGRWVEGPGEALFRAVEKELATEIETKPGGLPLLAEDLGEITDEVHALRERLGLPGMRVLQFAFGENRDDGDDGAHHAPHAHPRHAVVYTGTHDNDTSRGWYETADEETRRRFELYSGCRDAEGAARAMIRLAYGSPARLAVVPMQDLLGLGSAARMNTPGTREGNWTWRLRPGAPDSARAEEIGELVGVFDRG